MAIRCSARYHREKKHKALYSIAQSQGYFFWYPMTALELQQQRSMITEKKPMLWRPQQQQKEAV